MRVSKILQIFVCGVKDLTRQLTGSGLLAKLGISEIANRFSRKKAAQSTTSGLDLACAGTLNIEVQNQAFEIENW